MKKGEILIAKGNEKEYQIAGRWGKDVILMPTNNDAEQVLVYSESELDSLVAQGKFIRQQKAEIDMAESGDSIEKALFTRKAVDLDELKRRTGAGRDSVSFLIEKTVTLSKPAFTEFSDNLLNDFDFLKENNALMYIDTNRVWHCILVKETGSNGGILVESEGYDYARYSAIYTGK